MPVFSLGRNLGLRPALNFDHPEGSISVAIRDERDLLSIWRPTRVDVVERSIRNRKSIPSTRRHQPKRMPLLTEIRRVHHPLPIRRKIRTRLPRRFLVVNLPRLGSGFSLHPPEAPGSVNVSAIGNEK